MRPPPTEAQPIHRLGLVAQVNHLACHICPRGTWRDAVEELRQRAALFDGRRVFGVATGSDLESPDAVCDAVGDLATDVIVLANDPSLREVMTFPSMMSALRGLPGRLFYCHSKGATHPPNSVCQEWRRVMFETCLDHPRLIECMLERYPICGPFRRFGGLGVPWHFSGSFYWLRCADLWAQDWGNVQQFWYGVETYPSWQYTADQSGCLFLDNCEDLYDEGYWMRIVHPALDAWRKRMDACTE